MRIDLHAHSRRSDGTQSPAELVRAAAEAGIDHLALTDHDTARGWDEAAEAADQEGIDLVRGMEISCRFGGAGVHLLAYLVDPVDPSLTAQLDRVLDGRRSRIPAILSRLRDHGLAVDSADVLAISGETVSTGRPHVADALVARGYVATRREAFDRYLGPGGPAYVDRYAAPLEEMIGIVREAGGVSVVAHPWAARHRHDALDEAGFARLQAAGLAGIEVDHQDHPGPVRDELRAIARNLGLLVTGGSDCHGEGKVDHELGCETTAPDQFEALVSLSTSQVPR